MNLNENPILIQSPLFHKMNENEIKEALHILSAKRCNYKKGSYIYHPNDIPTSLGLVHSGAVQIIKEDYWGNRTLISQIVAGNLFAEAYACLNTPMTLSVIAAADSEIILLDISNLTAHQNTACFAPLTYNLMMILADKNRILSSQISHLSQRKLRDKLLSYLSEQARQQDSSTFDIPYNRQELADLLCADRSALSAELSRLRKEGILEYHKQHFKLF